MQPKMLTNFNGIFQADTEDDVSYRYRNNALVFDVKYDVERKHLLVSFEWCFYFYSYPFFGYSPFERKGSQLENKSIPEAGALYEHFDTDLMIGAKAFSEKWGTKLDHRHFSIFFENTGQCFDILAKNFDVIKSDPV